MANPMSHVAKSRILEEIIIEIRKKGIEIPANVMSDLKSARTLMKVEHVDSKNRGETEPEIDEYLSGVEAYVITEAGKLFPGEKVQKWLAALDIASCESCVTVVKAKEESRFILGLPRDQKWIRVEPLANQPMEKLKQMATETDLAFRPDKDGHLIVYGQDKDIKLFIKKMTQKSGQAP
jgi:hypothetical protein